ncbi:hypothetical protein FH972_024329 [Carpinus fangiana]|uniref:Uncharacterized protein n=1 Tax=Carpinus fangiana TaxID=176857 RepID=A0A5N6KY24_9ROSI|nr:hypothetical protein FH972_024329 [Carpinus fangiana]
MSDTGEGPSAPPPKATLKKQPKNAVRKSKAERDKLEKEEAKRRAERMREAQADERAAEASRKAQYGYQDERSGRGSRGGDRGRGRVITRPGRGGRGGFMGAPSFNTHGGGGSLPNTGSRGTGSRGARATSTRGGAKREPQIKTDADGDVSMLGLPPITKTEKEVYEIDSDEDEEAGQRVDIEHMMTIHNISSTDSDDDIDMTGELAGKGKKPAKGKSSKPPALAPVRIPRHEHPERKLGINTEASAASVSDAKRQLEVHDPDKATTGPGRKSKGKAKEVQYVGEKQLFRGVYIDEDPVIKPDPDDPEAVTEDHGKTKARSPTRARRKSSFKRTKSPGAQTEEEKRERAIQEHEASTIYDELGPSKRILVDGENGPEWVEHDQRTNNVYLFQLPPVMPGLVSATAKRHREPAHQNRRRWHQRDGHPRDHL